MGGVSKRKLILGKESKNGMTKNYVISNQMNTKSFNFERMGGALPFSLL